MTLFGPPLFGPPDTFRSWPRCRSRKRSASEDGKPEAVEKKYRCKTCHRRCPVALTRTRGYNGSSDGGTHEDPPRESTMTEKHKHPAEGRPRPVVQIREA